MPSSKLNAIKHIISTIYSAQNALRELSPEFNWSGLGNLLGDYGELIAIEKYDLTIAPRGSNGFDAVTKDNKTVQVKANHAAKMIGFRGEADLLLVLKVDDEGEWEELYFGPFDVVKQQARFSARDNKHTITITKLKSIKEKAAKLNLRI